MDIEEKIRRHQENMRVREMADDGYYLSWQYKEDMAVLKELKKLRLLS